jgi:hypothetical protein
MGFWGNLMNAGYAGVTTGFTAARRVFEDPARSYRENTYQQQQEEYRLLWSYYSNSMFDQSAYFLNRYLPGNNTTFHPVNKWQVYKSRYNLYRNIRMIYNPTKRLVDFYSGMVYPGVLSEDGAKLPDGVPMAIPFAEDTDPALKDAIAQFWQWSNWQAKKSVMVRYGAALGSVLVELIDDPSSRKVVANIIWPGFICDLDLDSAGNIEQYAVQYSVYDEDEGSYMYKKVISKEAFSYYKNGEPYDYGLGAEVPNVYGFVPAVWVKHVDIGGDHGSPAIAGCLGKIDELNNLASHVHDQIHKIIGAPSVLWSSGSINSLFNTQKRTNTQDFADPASDQESVLMLKGPADGHIDSLAGSLQLGETATYMDRLLAEIEQDHPELVYYRELRSMSTVTGPAASRLVGDVASRVTEVQAAYDMQSMKLFQMAVAIAGFRANSGAWGPLNRQQVKFAPFDLDSYAQGDLDLAIMPRPVLTPTKMEVATEKQAVWTGVKLAIEAGVPLAMVLKDEGWTDEEIAQMQQHEQVALQSQLNTIQMKQTLAQQDTIPPVGQ